MNEKIGLETNRQNTAMTPGEFCEWLKEMRERKRARDDKHCARLLGRSRSSISRMKTCGADKVTALACAALLNGLDPFRLDRNV